MIGFAVIFVMIIWFLIVEFFARIVVRNLIKNSFIKFIIVLALIVIIYPLPLLDEILAKPQFEKLCKDYSTVWIDKNSKAKYVYLNIGVHYSKIPNTWVDVVNDPWIYRDIETKKVVLRYEMLRASGGWLAKYLNFPEGGGPLLFDYSCNKSVDTNEIFKKMGITKVSIKDANKFIIN